jgi:poly(A) polymerase
MPAEWLEKLERIEWAHFYANPHVELALCIQAAHLPKEGKNQFFEEHLMRRRHLESAITRITTQRPLINAEYLMQEGITPGKTMGLLLKEAERISVNAGLEDPAQIIEMLKKSPLWHS